MKTLEQQLSTIISGLHSADSYISEDLEAICDETMQEYAESTLESVNEAQKTAGLYQKANALFLDVLADIAMHTGWCRLEFDDSHKRSQLLQQWAWSFVEQHIDTDWEQADYIETVDEFASKMVKEYAEQHPQTQYSIKVVLGTEACKEYDNAVDSCEMWDESSLADKGSITNASFDTEEELKAYMMGIEDAEGYLEARILMTDEEWQEWLKEYKVEE